MIGYVISLSRNSKRFKTKESNETSYCAFKSRSSGCDDKMSVSLEFEFTSHLNIGAFGHIVYITGRYLISSFANLREHSLFRQR